jgi:replicative DNA helicase
MKNTNPIIRAIENSRATVYEQIAAREYLDDLLPDNIAAELGQTSKPDLVAMGETVEEAKQNLVTGDKINGLSTGYESLDAMTRGMAKGELIVVFGDTSHGKSQLAQNISLNLALTEKPVLFVGLEMTNVENTVRFLQMLNDPQKAKDLPILYPKTSDVGYKDIASLVQAAVGEGAELIVIDHLHMFARNVDNMANEISLITHEFKRVARKHEIPIILISHINRAGTKGGVPQLADLKGSGSIEQDCDIALAVWRDMNDENCKELVVKLRKNRNRGRKIQKCTLEILESARLRETVTMDVFPTAPLKAYRDS